MSGYSEIELITQGLSIPYTKGTLGKITKSKLTKLQNNEVWMNEFVRGIEMAMERYHLEGAPDTISERIVLQSLLWRAGVVFFEKDGNLLAFSGGPGGMINANGDPLDAYVYARNGIFNEHVNLYVHGGADSKLLRTNGFGMTNTYKNYGVMVWENKMRYPFIFILMYLAGCIADSYRMLDTIRQNLKHPYVVTAKESAIKSIKDFFDKRDNNEEYILNTGIFDADKVQITPLTVNGESVITGTQLIDWYENKRRELCGIDSNSQTDKKGENLITDELHINDQYEDMMIDKCLEQLNYDLDLVNKNFGTNMRFVKGIKDDEGKTEDVSGDENGDGGLSSDSGRSDEA